jgi:hypothetical protein
MTVREFMSAVSQNPNFLDDELRVAAKIGKVDGGEYDGGVSVLSKSVQSIAIGYHGLLIFLDSNAVAEEMFLRDAMPLVIAGPTPESLKQ